MREKYLRIVLMTKYPRYFHNGAEFRRSSRNRVLALNFSSENVPVKMLVEMDSKFCCFEVIQKLYIVGFAGLGKRSCMVYFYLHI